MKLLPDRNTFAQDILLESTNGPLTVDPSFTYTGTLEGKLVTIRQVAGIYNSLLLKNFKLSAKWFLHIFNLQICFIYLFVACDKATSIPISQLN